MRPIATLAFLLISAFLGFSHAAEAEAPKGYQYHAKFVLGNGKTAQETSDFMLQKARELIHRVQVYTHDYTRIPVPLNPKLVQAVQKWADEYDKKHELQQKEAQQLRKSSRQDDGDEEEFTGPVRSPSIIRVVRAADVLLAVAGNRNDSIFNFTHQIQNVGKFVVNPVQGINGLVQNAQKFLGLGGQKSGTDSGENELKVPEAENSKQKSGPSVPAPPAPKVSGVPSAAELLAGQSTSGSGNERGPFQR